MHADRQPFTTAFRRLAQGLLLAGAMTLLPGPQPCWAAPVPAPIPQDFAVRAQAGSVQSDRNLYIFELDANGKGKFCVVPPANRSTGRCGTTKLVRFSAAEVRAVYDAVTRANFFTMAPDHIANVADGSVATLKITSRGITHSVLTQNLALPAFDNIMLALNAPLPDGSKLIYNAIFGQI